MAEIEVYPIAAGVNIEQDASIATNESGYAIIDEGEPGTTYVGVACHNIDNTNGTDGDMNIEVET
jgi:hypothetical protein